MATKKSDLALSGPRRVESVARTRRQMFTRHAGGMPGLNESAQSVKVVYALAGVMASRSILATGSHLEVA